MVCPRRFRPSARGFPPCGPKSPRSGLPQYRLVDLCDALHPDNFASILHSRIPASPLYSRTRRGVREPGTWWVDGRDSWPGNYWQRERSSPCRFHPRKADNGLFTDGRPRGWPRRRRRCRRTPVSTTISPEVILVVASSTAFLMSSGRVWKLPPVARLTPPSEMPRFRVSP